jgi:hypothetical protein
MSDDREAGAPLPVRTTPYRRPGRHSSPHQLSLPPDAPALVLAVPGPATPENEDVAAGIAGLASGSCPGARVLIGYLRGGTDRLDEVIGSLRRGGGKGPVVVVPLLAFPSPGVDAEIADIVARAGGLCLAAAPLGPHPLLAEALHVRLAEAGFARSTRVGRISVVNAADGVIVGAWGGEDAVGGAGLVAVLLASRLTIPVAPVSLSDPASISDAARQLHAARVTRVALAPCIIGPELDLAALQAVAAASGVACAPPIGCHPTIGQLVAIRYGAALMDPRLAELVS